jgi:antitoxin ParD1/3/4
VVKEPKVNVSLTPELEKLVHAKVQSGRYNSASEVVREALRLLEQHDDLRAIHLKELRSRMDQGLAELNAGEGTDGEAFMKEMLDDLDSRASASKAG